MSRHHHREKEELCSPTEEAHDGLFCTLGYVEAIAAKRNGDVASRASEWMVDRYLDNYKPYPIRIFNPHLT
jgi:hypothetical protein